MRIEMAPNGILTFSIDNDTVYVSSYAVSSTVLGSARPLWLGSSSSGDAGKAYHDDVILSGGCLLPDVPSLITPVNNDTVCSPPPNLVWLSVSTATMYNVQISTSSSFTGTVLNPKTTDTTYASALTVPLDCVTYYWHVRDSNSCGWSEYSPTRSLTICGPPSAPARIAPGEGATDVVQPITLRWDSLTAAAKYWVQVDDNSGYSSPAYNDSTTMARVVLPTLEEGVRYYWKVRAKSDCGWGNWSASNWTFTTRTGCPRPTAPTRLSPTDAATTVSKPVLIDWDTVLIATKYHLQIDDTADFVRPEVDDTTLTTTSLLVDAQLKDTTKYYWRMRGYDSCGWGAWHDVAWSFTTRTPCPLPTPPLQIAPENNVSALELPVLVDWGVGEEHLYKLKVDDTVTLVSPVIDTQLTVSNFTITNLDTNKSYYWAIRTHNSCGWGDWSPVHKFTIGIATAVEEIAGEYYPSQFMLSQNYPNPFNPTTAIEFSVPRTGQVTLDIYDVLGRRVRRLVSETVGAGVKRAVWDGCNADGAPAASGIYFYRIEAGEYRETRKMLLLK
jgi:hypothetical protein